MQFNIAGELAWQDWVGVFHSYGVAKQTKRNQLSFFFSFILIFSVTEDGNLLKLMVNTNANLPLRGRFWFGLVFVYFCLFFLKLALQAFAIEFWLLIFLNKLALFLAVDIRLLVVEKTLARAKSDVLVNTLRGDIGTILSEPKFLGWIVQVY